MKIEFNNDYKSVNIIDLSKDEYIRILTNLKLRIRCLQDDCKSKAYSKEFVSEKENDIKELNELILNLQG